MMRLAEGQSRNRSLVMGKERSRKRAAASHKGTRSMSTCVDMGALKASRKTSLPASNSKYSSMLCLLGEKIANFWNAIFAFSAALLIVLYF